MCVKIVESDLAHIMFFLYGWVDVGPVVPKSVGRKGV